MALSCTIWLHKHHASRSLPFNTEIWYILHLRLWYSSANPGSASGHYLEWTHFWSITNLGACPRAMKDWLLTLQPYWTTKEFDIEAFTTYLNSDKLILLVIRADSPNVSVILFLNQPSLVLDLQAPVKVFHCRPILLLCSGFFFVGLILDARSMSEFNLETFLSNLSLQELKSLQNSELQQIVMHIK